MDGAQFEAGPTATPYCDGSLGDGYAWTGTGHASSSTRQASRLQGTPRFDAAEGALAAWMRPRWAGGDGREHVIFHRATAEGDVLLEATAAGAWHFAIGAASVQVTQAHAVGADLLLLARWDPTTLTLRAGSAETRTSRSVIPSIAPGIADLGRRTDSAAGYLEGALGPVLMLSGTLPNSGAEALGRLTRAPRWSDGW